MANIARNPSVSLTVVDGIPTTTSNVIAEHFGKRHDNVVRDIQNLKADLPAEWCLLNFEETSVEVAQPNGGIRALPAYRLTRDGFTMLAMGFTGKKALAFKLAYIDAFNRMEAALQQAQFGHNRISLARQPAIPLPAAQAREIEKRLYRLAARFHPLSDPAADVRGVLRCLRGLHPNLGVDEPAYRRVLERPE